MEEVGRGRKWRVEEVGRGRKGVKEIEETNISCRIRTTFQLHGISTLQFLKLESEIISQQHHNGRVRWWKGKGRCGYGEESGQEE